MPKHRKQIKRLCTLDTYTSQNVEPSLKVTLCGERNSHVVLARGRMPARQASAPAARQREVRGAGRGRADMLKTVRCAGAPWYLPIASDTTGAATVNSPRLPWAAPSASTSPRSTVPAERGGVGQKGGQDRSVDLT